MSDDLVKRLRTSWDADRSIISQTDNWMRERQEASDRIEELEAKLAKAVEALDVDLIEQAISDVLLEGGTYRDAAEYVARTTLAELKGEDQ
jgi:hypothetical protein